VGLPVGWWCGPAGGGGAGGRVVGGGRGWGAVGRPGGRGARGGAWCRADDAAGAVGAGVHVGVEGRFTPARKAHPALVLDSVPELDAVPDRLAGLGFEVDLAERHTFDGHERAHVRDAHGNRVELLAPA